MLTLTLTLTINSQQHTLDADPEQPLLWVLRDRLQLKGTKYGCGVGLCGICTLLVDGTPQHACMLPLAKAAGKSIITIEGLAEKYPALVAAWIAEQVPQCGYCQGGQLLAAAALLANHRNPTDAEIDAALASVLCRCGTYPRIRRAIHRVAQGIQPLVPAVPALAPAPDAGIALNDFIRVHADDTVSVVINHSEMGQGALTNLAVLVAEELEVDLDRIRTEFAPADPKYKNPLWGQQFTGGSSSVRGEWEPLRRHAATAREQLIAAAMQHWDAPRDACRAEHGRVVHNASGRELRYSALAGDALRHKPPRVVALKQPGEFRLIGRPIPRLDIPDMVAGRTLYGIDIARPGMLVAVVARCPVFGGRVQRFDASAAQAVPGARAVIEIESGVAVLADDFGSALRGRECLHIEWHEGKHAALDNAAIDTELKAALAQSGKRIRNEGNAQRVLKNAARVFEADYFTPYLAHAPLEPMNCVAEMRTDGCDVWVGTQSQVDTHSVAARVAGLPKNKVHVHSQFLGGGFGRRLETDFVAEAVELAKKTGAPVQVIWTRADDLQHDMYRPAGAMHLAAALDANGFPSAWFMRIAGSEQVLNGIEVPYAIPNLREEHVEVPSAIPTGAWRSVGASQNAFAIECFVDELAHAAGQDPFEYRQQLLQALPREHALLELATDQAGWGTPLPAGHGRGIARYRSFGSSVAQVAEVAVVQGAIRVERVVCAIDCGITVNPDSVRAQLEGAIAFGLSAALKEEIRIERGRVVQANFTDYPILTLAEMPVIEIHIMPSNEPPGGVGEPGVPVIAPAVANAVFAATGKRLRRLPLRLPS
jgi:isoquinoline 1-oxidoreductase beta subunit